jgi:hypothetical protein
LTTWASARWPWRSASCCSGASYTPTTRCEPCAWLCCVVLRQAQGLCAVGALRCADPPAACAPRHPGCCAVGPAASACGGG